VGVINTKLIVERSMQQQSQPSDMYSMDDIVLASQSTPPQEPLAPHQQQQASSGAPAVTDEEVISGRFFLRQLCLVDKFFGMLAEDYLDRILRDLSTSQSINNWNIISVCLADHGLQCNDEVLFRLMAGDSELASGLTEDIHKLKDFHASQAAASRAAPRWRVLSPSGQKETPLKLRLNPFIQSKDSAKPPTSIYVFDADRLSKTRTQVVLQMKELESKLAKAKEKKSNESRVAEAAAQQKMLEEQISSINLQKSDMLRLLEGLEAKFVADERRINQMRRLAGEAVEPAVAPAARTAGGGGGAVSPAQPAIANITRASPVRLRDATKMFAQPTRARK
jgi:hypothetical protein